MYYNAYDHRIFDPSTSWINKAGVHLEYTPEDTLKSAIFNPDVSSELPGETAADQVRPGPKNTGIRESPEGSLPQALVESECSARAQTKSQSESKVANSESHKPATQRPGPTRPAPFLKRRQGMSAWCSKIRKQGLPVRDPAEELRKLKNGNSPARPIRNSSVDTCRAKSHTLNAPRAKSASDYAPNPSLGDGSKKSNTLWCGLKYRRRSSCSPKDEEAVKTVKDLHNGDPVQKSLTTVSPGATKVHEPPEMTLSLGDEFHNDVGDLEEFEILEEMAENSSFSSLTTSFVAKLSKTCLRERLKQAETKIDELNLKDTANCASPQEPEAYRFEGAQNSCVIQETVATKENDVGHPAERSILSVLDKHRSRRNSEQLNSVAGDRTMDSILADASQGKSRKVARFQFVHGQSQSKEDKSFESHAAEPPPADPEHPPVISSSKLSVAEVAPRDSLEFDDGNSWTCSASDSGEPNDQIKISSALDLSISTVSNPVAGKASEVPQEGPDLLRVDPLAQQKRRTKSRSPSSAGKSKERWSESMAVKRFTSRPMSASAQLGSKPGHVSRNAASSYEDELINLADDFVDQLKREPPAPGQSSHTQAVLRQWISRLEAEVKRFKMENANLLKMRSERDESMRRLEMETKRFEEFKAREIRLFTEMKENESRKLKKERRVLEEYQRALKTMPSKKDREEIERLKDELHEARSDLSRREVRWHTAIARLRSRIEELEHERDDLKGRIHRLEDERVSLQSQLAELKVSGGMSKIQLRRNGSSASSTRQTLSSVSQSIALKPSKSVSEDSKDVRSNVNMKRLRQQKQYLYSCRLSNRSTSRLGVLDNVHCPHSHRSTASVSPSNLDMPPVHTDHSSARTVPTLHQVVPSNVGTRESVVSGGYFTEDDECVSNGSARADVQQSKGDIVPERNTVASTTFAGSSDPSLHAVQVLSPVSRQHNPNPSAVVQSTIENPKTEAVKLPEPRTAASGSVVRTVKHADGSVEETYSNGAVIVTYANGSVKEVFPDAVTIVVSLFNGDTKRTLPDGRVIYHYAADGTVQTTYPDGTEEINYADGRQEIIHVRPQKPEDTTQNTKDELMKQSCRRLPNGDREIRLPNGQREIHSASGVKCRIYPDGTTKTVFPDGRHETRYASGRLRIKDANGSLLLDTRLPTANRPFPDPPCNLLKALSLPPPGRST